MDNNYEIKYNYGNVIIEKNDETFSVEKGADDDIWFSTNNDIRFSINFYSRNRKEWQTYFIFENLMKLIIGRYILHSDNNDEYSNLPKDFIDLESKTITWHSDSEKDNKLQLQFTGKEIIVSIMRDENASKLDYFNPIKVRIRTSGSKYEYYYQEFEVFFDELLNFAYQITPASKDDIPNVQRKLSFFNKFKKH